MPTSRKPAPRQESRPSRNTTNGYAQYNGDYRHQVPTADERRETQLLEELRSLGYRIAVQCTVCGSWVSNPKSVRAHMGPVCRAKAVAR